MSFHYYASISSLAIKLCKLYILFLSKIFTRKISDIRKHTTYTNFPANHQHLNSNKTTCSDKDNLFPWIWNLLVYSLKFLRDKVYT